MRNAMLTLAAAVALTAMAPAAMAQPVSADQSDARCLMVLQFIARDPQQSEQAAKGIYYYLGRLSSRGPVARIEALMKAEAPKMQQQLAQTELARCGAELNNRTKEFQAVNQKLAATFAPKGAAPAPKSK
ncbi:MAG: hypothetical protein DI570_15960 [Phenylobacterium zucineum]|nr:MAG: hypothetical protein DI570_15960 [Phenylobacterium zucineum]